MSRKNRQVDGLARLRGALEPLLWEDSLYTPGLPGRALRGFIFRAGALLGRLDAELETSNQAFLHAFDFADILGHGGMLEDVTGLPAGDAWKDIRPRLEAFFREVMREAAPTSTEYITFGTLVWAALYHGVCVRCDYGRDEKRAMALYREVEKSLGRVIDEAAVAVRPWRPLALEDPGDGFPDALRVPSPEPVATERTPTSELPSQSAREGEDALAGPGLLGPEGEDRVGDAADLEPGAIGIDLADEFLVPGGAGVSPAVWSLFRAGLEMRMAARDAMRTVDIARTEAEQAARAKDKLARSADKARLRIQELEAALASARQPKAASSSPSAEPDRAAREATLVSQLQTATQRAIRATSRNAVLDARVAELERENARLRVAVPTAAPVPPAAPRVGPAIATLDPTPLAGRRAYLFTNHERGNIRGAMQAKLLALGATDATVYEFDRGAAPGPSTFPSGSVVIVDTSFAQHRDSEAVKARVRGRDVCFVERAFGIGSLEAVVREVVPPRTARLPERTPDQTAVTGASRRSLDTT